MARISKPPEERKKEIVETAAKIFNEKGYENTAVSDIVKSINVAQGTFYYHFKSKDELIEPVVEFIMNKSLKEVEEIIDRNDMNSVEKIKTIIANRIKFVSSKMKVVRFMWNKGNNFLFEKFRKYAIPKAAPIFKKLVEQGREEGIVNVEYPDETIRVLIIVMLDFAEEAIYSEGNASVEMIYKRFEAYENIIKRILGIKSEFEISIAQELIKEMTKLKNQL